MISDESFPKKEHLAKTSDFRRVYNNGVAFKSKAFILYHIPNAFGVSRIGLSISSRNIKRANARNRLKRLFREVYRRRKKDIKSGLDMVMVVRRDPGEGFYYRDAEKLFLELAERAGILT